MAADVQSIEQIDANGVKTQSSLLHGQDSSGNSQPIGVIDTGGSVYAAKVSLATTISGEDQTNDVIHVEAGNGYKLKSVGSSQTNVLLGAAGAAGDFIHTVTIRCFGISPVVTLTDGSDTYQLTSGLDASDIRRETFNIVLDAVSETTGWKVTTGGNCAVVVSGRFTEE